ncbi:MAG: hypothetical protein PHE49_09435 [bacterium]|nr:hypothetical protein [bacterium]
MNRKSQCQIIKLKFQIKPKVQSRKYGSWGTEYPLPLKRLADKKGKTDYIYPRIHTNREKEQRKILGDSC